MEYIDYREQEEKNKHEITIHPIQYELYCSFLDEWDTGFVRIGKVIAFLFDTHVVTLMETRPDYRDKTKSISYLVVKPEVEIQPIISELGLLDVYRILGTKEECEEDAKQTNEQLKIKYEKEEAEEAIRKLKESEGGI